MLNYWENFWQVNLIDIGENGVSVAYLLHLVAEMLQQNLDSLGPIPRQTQLNDALIASHVGCNSRAI